MKLVQLVTSNSELSRRRFVDLLKAGKVTVDGRVVESISMDVHPKKQSVHVDGKRIHVKHSGSRKSRVYKFYKPKNVISTMSDPKGRPCLDKYLTKADQGLRPVGRLDRQTTGLLIFTDDGELGNRILHPRYELRKDYRVTVNRRFQEADGQALLDGIQLEDGPLKMDRVEILEPKVILVTLHEGRNRIVRRAFQHFGYDVVGLKRVAIGPVSISGMKMGSIKPLTPSELRQLKDLLSLK